MGASRRDFLKNSGLMIMAGTTVLTTEQWLRGADGAAENDFLNKFKKLGLIAYSGGLKINPSLLSVVVHD